MKVILVMALTADGKIGRTPEHFPDWTGKSDKQLFKRISQQAGVVVMGSKTFDTFGRPLPGRKNVVMTRNPKRSSDQADLVFTGAPPQQLLATLSREGYREVILAGGAVINTLFAQANLIDEMIITISPKIFGQGLSLFTGPLDIDLELLAIDRPDANLILTHYRVVK